MSLLDRFLSRHRQGGPLHTRPTVFGRKWAITAALVDLFRCLMRLQTVSFKGKQMPYFCRKDMIRTGRSHARRVREAIEKAESEVMGCFDTPRRDWWGTLINREEIRWYLNASRERIRLVIKNVLDFVEPGANIVEVGAAYGVTILALRNLGYRVVASDAEHSIRSYGDALVQTGIENRRWDFHLDPCPFDSGSADAVIASEVLEHLQISLSAAILRVKQPLRPGGVAIFTTPNIWRLGNIRKVIKGENVCEAFPDTPAVKNGVIVDARCHPREPSMKELEAATLDNGLSVLRKQYFSAEGLPPIKRSAFGVLPFFNAHLLLVGRRDGR